MSRKKGILFSFPTSLVLLNSTDPNWEVDKKSLTISQTIGKGAFGVVMKASLPGGLVHGERKTVAVKTAKGLESFQ